MLRADRSLSLHTHTRIRRREIARSRIESEVQEELSASVSALLSSHGTAISANFGSAHMAAPQVVAENLEAARQRRMDMLLEQRVEQERHHVAMEERRKLVAQGPEGLRREVNARRVAARAEEAQVRRSIARAWAEEREEDLASRRPTSDDTILGPALITQTVQVWDKEPIQRAGGKGKAAKRGGGVRHDYSQSHFHAVQVLRHVPPTQSTPAEPPFFVATAGAPRSGISAPPGGGGGAAGGGWDEASLYDASGERAMLNAADAAAAAAAMLESRNVQRERERQKQADLRRQRGSQAAEWLRKQHQSKDLEEVLDSYTAKQKVTRNKTARDTANAQAFRERRRDAAERDARRKEEDLLDALLGPVQAPGDEDGGEEDGAAGGETGMYGEEDDQWDSLDEEEEAWEEREVEASLKVQREAILRRYQQDGPMGEDADSVQIEDVDEGGHEDPESEGARRQQLDDSLVAYAREVGGLDSQSAQIREPASSDGQRAVLSTKLLPTSLATQKPASGGGHVTQTHAIAQVNMNPVLGNPVSRGVVESISAARSGGRTAEREEAKDSANAPRGQEFLSEIDRILGRKDSSSAQGGVWHGAAAIPGAGGGKGEASKEGAGGGADDEDMEPFMVSSHPYLCGTVQSPSQPRNVTTYAYISVYTCECGSHPQPHHFLKSTYMLDSRGPDPQPLPTAVTAAAEAATKAVNAATRAVESLRDPSLTKTQALTHTQFTSSSHGSSATARPASAGQGMVGSAGAGGSTGAGRDARDGGRGAYSGARVGGEPEVKVGGAGMGSNLDKLAQTQQMRAMPQAQASALPEGSAEEISDTDSLDQR